MRNENYHDYDPVFVYVIKGGPFIKIGISSDINARIGQLKTGSQYPISLAYYRGCESRPDALLWEKTLHNRLSKYRHKGEWFYIHDRIDDLFGNNGFTLVEEINSFCEHEAAILELKRQKDAKDARHQEAYEAFLYIIDFPNLPPEFEKMVKQAIYKYPTKDILDRAKYLKWYIDASNFGDTAYINKWILNKVLKGEQPKPKSFAVKAMFKKIWSNLSYKTAGQYATRLNAMDEDSLELFANEFNKALCDVYRTTSIREFLDQNASKYGY